MLNKRILFVALALTVSTALMPSVASARPLRGETVNSWKTAVSALMTWWGIYVAPVQRTDWTKNGCGIDPNGDPLPCGSLPGGGGGGTGVGGSGLQGGTEEDPADSGI
jgi:hypothetical protein